MRHMPNDMAQAVIGAMLTRQNAHNTIRTTTRTPIGTRARTAARNVVVENADAIRNGGIETNVRGRRACERVVAGAALSRINQALLDQSLSLHPKQQQS